MTPSTALLAYIVAATLLTITPGLDTALVLRTSAVEGRRSAIAAAAGVCVGLLAWGVAVALGLGALLTASETAYTVLTYIGAAYLIVFGLTLLFGPRRTLERAREAPPARGEARRWFGRGFFTDVLNPKIGIFYASFLPQFIPAGVEPASWLILLALVHIAVTIVWFALLIGLTLPLARALRRPAILQWLDRVTGSLFVAGAVLAVVRR